MKDLKIERGVTGFVVWEEAPNGYQGKMWAFETPEALSKFMLKWAADDRS